VNRIWEKNKRFILIVVGGLVVVLFGWNYARSAIVGSSERVVQAQGTINNQVDEISEAFLQTEWRTGKEAALLERDESVAERLKMLIAPEPGAQLPSSNPGADMKKMIDDAIRAVDENGRRKGTRVTAKNWGLGSMVGGLDTQDQLKPLQVRLEATERLLGIAIDDARVREIESVGQDPAFLLTVPHSGGEKAVEVLPIKITCYGSVKTLSRFVFEISNRRDDGKSNFFYLIDAKIFSGRKKTVKKRPGSRGTRRPDTGAGSEEDARCGTFTCCALRIVKSEGRKTEKIPGTRRSGRRTRTRRR
jgi:hypothetical protein